MKKVVLLSLFLLLSVVLTFGQSATAGAKAATTVVGVASTVASSDMGPGVESLKADVQEDYTVVAGNTLKAVSAQVYGDYRYWPIVYLTNKETISNPELIEPATAFKIYKLPFDPAVPGDISKLLIVETYLQTYARYLELGSDWTWQRRWVLLEAMHFSPELFSKSESRIDATDLEWYKSR